MLAAAGLSCCREAAPEKAPEAPSPFFQLRDGKLERLQPQARPPQPAARKWWQAFTVRSEAPAAAEVPVPAETPALPWTVQARVADMAVSGGKVYLALNGSGLATVDLADPAQPVYAYHPDSLIFRGRTISSILPSEGSVLCHLYYNAALNTVEAKDLGFRPVGLVSFDPSIGEYRFHTTPTQRRDASWEPVGFAPLASGGWLFEWKIAQEESSRFSYTRLLPDRKTEEKALREDYMAAMEPTPCGAKEVPPSLRSLFDLALSDLEQAEKSGGPQAAVDFMVRGPEGALPARYRQGGPGEGILHVPVWGAGSEWTALLPRGALLRTRIGAEPEWVALPSPPEGCRYTCLLVHGGTALVGWEQARFTDVAAAGLLVFRTPSP